jgi:hypothetical protein
MKKIMLILFLSLSNFANAGLIGDSVTIQSTSGILDVIVSAGIETTINDSFSYGSLNTDDYIEIDITDNSIDLNLVGASGFYWGSSPLIIDFIGLNNFSNPLEHIVLTSLIADVSLGANVSLLDSNDLRISFANLEGNSILNNNNARVSIGLAVSEVPEPTTLAIFGLGLIGLASRKFKKQS